MNVKMKAALLMVSLVLTIGLVSAQNYEPQTFTGVTPAVFNEIKAFAQDYGICVPDGNYGEISYTGVSARFMWDGKSSLTIQFTDLPFFVNDDLANAQLNKFINQFIPV